MASSTQNVLYPRDRLDARWDLVAIGIVVNTCLGTVYSWSVFRAPVEQAIGLTTAQSGVPYSVFLAAFAFSMPLAGTLMTRLGTRLTLLIGGVLVAAGWIGGGMIEDYLLFVLVYGVVGGVGVGFAYGVPLAVAGSWFRNRRGFAMGLTLAGFGVSPFVTAPLAEVLINWVGVQYAKQLLGVLFLAVVCGLSPLFKKRPDHDDRSVEHRGDRPTEAAAPQARPMLQSRSFYGFWVCYVIGTLTGLTAIGMTASFGMEVVGLSGAVAAATVSAFGILNGVGRPIFGSIHDSLGTRRTVVLSFLLIACAASVSLFTGPGTRLPFFVGFGLFWFMLGAWLSIAPAATSRLFGAENYARNYGIMYTAYGVGALTGGAASARFYARFGSYDPLFLLVIALCVAGIAIAIATIRQR